MSYKEQITWHELSERKITDEERGKYKAKGCLDYEIPEFTFDCKMPDDLQDILIVTRYGVATDTCWHWHGTVDFCYRLQRHGDWDGVLAWADMPKYKAEGETDGS